VATDAVTIVQDFWFRMASNDFSTIAPLLAADFTLEWPQSNERIRGAENFIRVNADYPAAGPWRFTVNQIVGADRRVVSDVTVTDGASTARAISFFTIAAGKIIRLVEFWPEPYPAPRWRLHLVERITPPASAIT
jgi:ketosteroid isomerase-like protein